MIKNTIFIFLVAILAYYAGAKGLTPVKVLDWFEKREINQTIEDVFNKSIEIAQQKEVSEKATGIID